MSVHIIKTSGATRGRFTDFKTEYLQLMTAICFPASLGAELLQVATIGNVETRRGYQRCPTVDEAEIVAPEASKGMAV